jgi:hypothetical protein
MGTKAAGEGAIGIMVSLDGGGAPDGNYRIGGTTLPWINRATGLPVANRWAIHFKMPAGIDKRQRFALVVYDTTGAEAARRDHLYIKKGARRATYAAAPAAPSLPLSIYTVVDPVTGGSASRDYFVAYGLLPDGNDAVNEAQTEVVNSADFTEKWNPTWSWTDGSGFWAAFFPTLTGMTNVNLSVVYSPNNDEEEATNITVS